MKLDTDRVVSISAMIAALGSLFIIVYQTHLMRQQQNAAALPYLMLAINSSEQGAFINLRNVGVGPALIETVRVRDKVGTIEGDAYDYYLARNAGADKEGALSVDKVIPGQLIPAGQTLQILGMSAPRRGERLSTVPPRVAPGEARCSASCSRRSSWQKCRSLGTQPWAWRATVRKKPSSRSRTRPSTAIAGA